MIVLPILERELISRGWINCDQLGSPVITSAVGSPTLMVAAVRLSLVLVAEDDGC